MRKICVQHEWCCNIIIYIPLTQWCSDNIIDYINNSVNIILPSMHYTHIHTCNTYIFVFFLLILNILRYKVISSFYRAAQFVERKIKMVLISNLNYCISFVIVKESNSNRDRNPWQTQWRSVCSRAIRLHRNCHDNARYSKSHGIVRTLFSVLLFANPRNLIRHNDQRVYLINGVRPHITIIPSFFNILHFFSLQIKVLCALNLRYIWTEKNLYKAASFATVSKNFQSKIQHYFL